ncbi:MAG TPA: hypothetical protein PLH68_07135, partial [Anaerolineaceae bacterium]|nr:hypothetical protein [Anaerolineaceae bacterium]
TDKKRRKRFVKTHSQSGFGSIQIKERLKEADKLYLSETVICDIIKRINPRERNSQIIRGAKHP